MLYLVMACGFCIGLAGVISTLLAFKVMDSKNTRRTIQERVTFVSVLNWVSVILLIVAMVLHSNQ